MLAYLKEPMGVGKIEGYDIYGKYYARGKFGPTAIPSDVFFRNRHVLEQFEITSEWLSIKLNKEFPSLSFSKSTFSTVDFQTVIEVAKLIGIDYKSGRKISDLEKRALRRAVLARIEELYESKRA